jgi:hypothetical protein
MPVRGWPTANVPTMSALRVLTGSRIRTLSPTHGTIARSVAAAAGRA